MKKSNVPGLKVAMEFESIQAVGSGKRDAVSPRLYAIEGVSGVFRRVPRSGRGLDAPRDAILCSYDGSIIELVMAEEVMEELAEALFPLKGDDTAHVAHILDRRDNVHTEGVLKDAFKRHAPIALAVKDCTESLTVDCSEAPAFYSVECSTGTFRIRSNHPFVAKAFDPSCKITREDLEDLRNSVMNGGRAENYQATMPQNHLAEEQPCDQTSGPASTPGTPTEPSASSPPPQHPRRRST